MLTGGEGFTDMEVFGHAKLDWLKTFLELPNTIPSHDTFNRVFSAIDAKALRRAMNEGASIPYKAQSLVSRPSKKSRTG